MIATRAAGSGCLILLTALVAACAPTAQPPPPAADPAGGLSVEILDAALAQSWMRAMVRDPGGLTALLDGPGGSGWLAVHQGDLEGAAGAFVAAPGPAAQLGLARVALERAVIQSAAQDLAEQSALQLARYRRDHRDRLRSGPLEPVLLALTLVAAHAPAEEVAEAVELARASSSDPAAGPLLALLLSRTAGAPAPRDLPEPLSARLQSSAALARGTLVAIPGDPGTPDVVDDLGADADSGVAFSTAYFDLDVGRARIRRELLLALSFSAGLGPADDAVRAVAVALWGGDVAVLPPPTPSTPLSTAGPPLPEWALLFGMQAVDLPDLLSGLRREGRALDLLSRLDGEAPRAGLRTGTDGAATDRLLRLDTTLEQLAAQALVAGAPPDGVALVAELGLGRRVADRVLRLRMDEVVAAGSPAQAQRLGQRAMDMTPGGPGARHDATWTRISARNPSESLLRFAACLAAGRSPGQAREYVHPLLAEVPGLAGPAYALGQLDAASSIGVPGKTSQQ